MGFYAVACMLTGRDLRELDVCLVPLVALPDGRFRPFALPVRGAYDYYGGVEYDEQDELVVLLNDFATRCRTSGRLTIDHTRMPSVVTDDTDLLELINRNHVTLEFQGHHACLLDGRGLAYSLISQPAWENAVALGNHLSARAPIERGMHAGDPDVESAYLHEIYGPRLPTWRNELHALTAVARALPTLNHPWHWPTEFPD